MGDENRDALEEFIRFVRESGSGVVMEVGVVEWAQPHTPTVEWKMLKAWSSEPTQAELDTEKERALADPRYFSDCEMCGERHNAGHMHDDRICQGCAQKYLRVVY